MGVIAIIVVISLLCMRNRKGKSMGVVKHTAVQPEPEFKAKPFYEAYSKGPEPDRGTSTADIEADAASGKNKVLILMSHGLLWYSLCRWSNRT